MPLNTKQKEEYHKAITEFLLALAAGDRKKAKEKADVVFVYANIYADMQKNDSKNNPSNPYLLPDIMVTKVMLEALKTAISSHEVAVKTHHKHRRSAKLITDVKKYAQSTGANARSVCLKRLIDEYSNKAKDQKVGNMNHAEASQELIAIKEMAITDLKKYCEELINKLRSVELDDEDYKRVQIRYLHAQMNTQYEPYAVQTLIDQSISLIKLDATIESRITKVVPDKDFNPRQSLTCAMKLVDSLYKLVDFMYRLGDKLKLITGMETKEQQRNNLLWKHHPAILVKLEDLKEVMEENNANLDRLNNLSRLQRNPQGGAV